MIATSTPKANITLEQIRYSSKSELPANHQLNLQAKLEAEIMNLSRDGKSAVKIVSHLKKAYPDIDLRYVYRVLYDRRND